MVETHADRGWWNVPPAERFAEGAAAYRRSRFAPLSMDFLSRYSRDEDARPHEQEVAIDQEWVIDIPADAGTTLRLMTGHLARFFTNVMGLDLPIREIDQPDVDRPAAHSITVLPDGGGDPCVPESFSIDVRRAAIIVRGRDEPGARDGVVRLVDLLGFRQAPYLPIGATSYRPRLPLRLGAIPKLGSGHDAVFHGYNAVLIRGGSLPALHGASLQALSTSQVIPELTRYQDPEALRQLSSEVAEVRRYGLRPYLELANERYPEHHEVWRAHPEARGARTWSAEGDFVLCSEHPLVREYLEESVAGILQAVPGLAGLLVIVGGESFYHCFMRAHGSPLGHTSCPRCEKEGPYETVARLCNRLASAARSAAPQAELIAWPYSAAHVWSEDPDQVPFIERLTPGVAVLTEVEKNERVTTPHGASVELWDYSLHLAGVGTRARRQVDAGQRVGVPVYLKSEPELSFEAARLPHMPCLDLWVDRAEALATTGGAGAWDLPYLRPSFGTAAAEVSKHLWWEPVADRATVLDSMAARIAGAAAAPHLRRAWTLASGALAFSPELPPYYTGPLYLGPAHPMCVNPSSPLPSVFLGKYLFHGEIGAGEADRLEPTYLVHTRGQAGAVQAYRLMQDLLEGAYGATVHAAPLVPDRCRLMFDSEASSIRFFYRTVRTTANFYESCALRGQVAGAAHPSAHLLGRWLQVLRDEQENATAAIPEVEADIRLETHVTARDHLFLPLKDMLRAKLTLLEEEIGWVAAMRS